ncbi:hypothetical protein ACWKWK_09695 [Pseudoxanthomonas beigongshangi]
MPFADWAYAGYILWLCAGLADFTLHWREDLAHTSGWAESRLHLLQLGLMGAGVLSWLYLQPSWLVLLLLALLAAVHAVAGYHDTRIAYPLRRIGPLEQHVHSVLDMAPWFAVVALAGFVMTDAERAGAMDWHLALREPWPAPGLQMRMLLPAGVLVVVPALIESRAAWRARTG